MTTVYGYSLGMTLHGICETEELARIEAARFEPVLVQGYWVTPDVFAIAVNELEQSPYNEGIIRYQRQEIGKPSWLVMD